MELYQLEYFLEAARQRSFTRAAEHLYLAQAALSEQMRKLEGELGTRLFDRGRRETTLTAAGETLRQHAEILLTQAAAARQAVRDVTERKAGRLVLAAIPSVSGCLLPEVMTGFRKQLLAVQFKLLEGTSEQVQRWVDDGRAEVGIVQHPLSQGVFTETLLLEEPFVALVSQTHPLAKRRRVQLKNLRDETLVFYRGRARDAALNACRSAGFEPHVASENSELGTVAALVAAKIGIAILPALTVAKRPPRCAVVKLDEESLRRQIVSIQRPGVSLSPAAIHFLQLLQVFLSREEKVSR